MSFIIEARRCRNIKGIIPENDDEWEPVSLTLHPRKYHYDTAREAEQCLETFFAKEDGLPQLIVRLATGVDKISNLLEFRIVGITVMEQVDK